jgi:HTH-type transcriptional repressor of NAD biosynthesis genes
MTTGLVLGKFLPPHKGHQYLIDFARNYVDELTVIVGTLRNESIAGSLRFQWMKESFPTVRLVHLTDENPQEPQEHPDFWKIWRNSIRKFITLGPDYVFASEKYGQRLAEELGSTYIPVDEQRELVPISGSQIRHAPLKHWEYLLPVVRPHFLKRICIFGPESTGKSTLAKDLAHHYETCHVAEYARTLLTALNNEFTEDDFHTIARGHIASENAMALQANRLLFVDTDLLTTTLWSKVFYNHCHLWIEEAAQQRHYALYLVTDVDVPWVADAQRFLPKDRQEFLDKCIHLLEELKRPYVLLRGSWKERFKKACQVIDKLISSS